MIDQSIKSSQRKKKVIRFVRQQTSSKKIKIKWGLFDESNSELDTITSTKKDLRRKLDFEPTDNLDFSKNLERLTKALIVKKVYPSAIEKEPLTPEKKVPIPNV